MLFNSIPYFIFLAIALIAYYVIPGRFRSGLLLVCSYFFYLSFDWRFGGLLLAQTAICYGAGIGLERVTSLNTRKWCVALVCLLSFGCLGGFKYCNFCLESFEWLCHVLRIEYVSPHLDILLPVGISFFIFQSVGYVVDVYRGKFPAERSFPVFALFVAFFPQLACGPIGRSFELIPQLKTPHSFVPEDIEAGLNQIVWGLFKKVVIADRLAGYVNMVYGGVYSASSPSLLLAAIFFSIQIYCDFSGYTDIAIGSARLFRIRLRKNFDFPYFAESINEFWKRWHISLTSWFRDYLYIPLGGNRCSIFRWGCNVLLVFLVSGLWHGAAWTFIVWGGLHGALQLLENAVRGRKPAPYGHWWSRFWATLLTLGLVTMAWVFFRAPDFPAALAVFKGIACWHGRLAMGASQVTFLLNGLLVIALLLMEIVLYHWRNVSRSTSPWLRSVGFATLLSAIALLGQSSESFIYLQF